VLLNCIYWTPRLRDSRGPRRGRPRSRARLSGGLGASMQREGAVPDNFVQNKMKRIASLDHSTKHLELLVGRRAALKSAFDICSLIAGRRLPHAVSTGRSCFPGLSVWYAGGSAGGSQLLSPPTGSKWGGILGLYATWHDRLGAGSAPWYGAAGARFGVCSQWMALGYPIHFVLHSRLPASARPPHLRRWSVRYWATVTLPLRWLGVLGASEA
jgi:hypothetical protein